MIRLIEWMLGDRRRPNMDDLDAQRDEAEAQRTEARQTRERTERTGKALRMTLDENHLGERFELALHPRGWNPR